MYLRHSLFFGKQTANKAVWVLLLEQQINGLFCRVESALFQIFKFHKQIRCELFSEFRIFQFCGGKKADIIYFWALKVKWTGKFHSENAGVFRFDRVAYLAMLWLLKFSQRVISFFLSIIRYFLKCFLSVDNSNFTSWKSPFFLILIVVLYKIIKWL